MRFNKYKKWIEENVIDPQNQCEKYSKLMITVFPELTLVRGHYDNIKHWWTETVNGIIIDPTVTQFNDNNGIYTPIDENNAPIGKCMECGNLSFYRKNFCSKHCENDYLKYLNSF